MTSRLLVVAGLLLSACAPVPASLQREQAELGRRIGAGGRAAARTHRDYGWVKLVLGEGEAGEAELRRAEQAGLHDARTLFGLALRAHDTAHFASARDLWTRLLEGYDRGDPWAAPLAEVAAHRLLTLVSDAPGEAAAEKDHVARVQRLWRDSARLPAEARQLLAALLGQLLRIGGREAEAQQLDAERGCPAAFYVSGPHGHLPRLDLLRSFPPDDPDRDPGRAAYRRVSSRGCDLLLDGAQGCPGVMYAIAWAHLADAAEVPMTVESGGELWALYVDGERRWFEEEPLRRRHLVLRLAAGWHAVALKVSVPQGRTQLQLVLPGATFADPAAPPTAAAREGAAAARALSPLPAAHAAWEKALSRLVLAQQAYIAGDVDAGLRAAEEALPEGTRFASLQLLQAGLLGDDSSRPQRIVRDRVRRSLSRALGLDPGLLRARLNLAYLEMQEDHAEEALALLDSMPAPAPRPWPWQLPLLRYRILRQKQWLREAEDALDDARRAGPSACAPLEALVDLRRELKDDRGALAASRKLAACNPYSDRHAEVLRQAGDIDGAEREYRRLLALEPESENYAQALAEALYLRGTRADLLQAQKLLEGLLRRHPRAAYHRVRLANVLVELSARKQAVAVLQAGLRETPEAPELHRALLALGVPSVMDVDRLDGRAVVREFERDREHLPESAGEPAIIVLDRTVMHVFPSGARLTLTHNIMKVLTKDGIDRFGEVQVPQDAEVLTLRTIKADGTTREPEEIAEKETVSAPDLEVGDYVEFEYIDREGPPAAFPVGFLSERFYFMSPEAPLYRTEYLVVTPWAMPLQVSRRGPAPPPLVNRRGDERVTVWARQKVPRLLPEPPQADALMAEWMPSVRVGSGITHARWRDWLRDRLFEAQRPNDELRRLAREVAGTKGPREPRKDAELRERAGRLGRWVQRNIKQAGSIDEQATAILARREGSRNGLLLALLRAAGVPCELWLARPAGAARLDDELPDVEAYSEGLLAIGPAHKPGTPPLLWLDPVYRNQPPGLVRPALRGARALRVPARSAPPEATASFAVVDSRGDDLRRVEMQVKLQADGGGRVEVHETLRGWPALEWREELERVAGSEVRKELEQRSLGFYFPGATLEDLRYGPVDKDDQPLDVVYSFRAPRLARLRQAGEAETGNGGPRPELVLPAPFPALLSKHYVGVPRRTTPLLLHLVTPTELEARIELPEGAGEPLLAPAATLDAFGHFVQRAERDGRRIHLHAEFAMPLQRVEPERYPDFLRFAARVDAAEDSVALIPLPPTAAPRR